MLPKYELSNMDQLLCAIVILGAVFLQCLPIHPRTNKIELLDLCIAKRDVWRHFKIFSQIKNMLVDSGEQEFAEYFLQLWN